MYLTVDSLTYINNITTGSNDITPRKVNVKPYWCNKIHMDKDLIEDKLCQLIDQLLDNIHPFYDGNGKTCKILFLSNFSYRL